MWTTEKYVGADSQADAVIRVRQQNAVGGWGSAVQVGAITETDDAQLVVSASGAAAVVWEYVQGGAHAQTVMMVATRRSAHGAWSAAKRIWAGAGAGGVETALGTDATGDVTVAWAGDQTTDPSIRVASVNAGDDIISQREQVAAAGAGGAELSLAENGAGATVLSWQRQLPGAAHPRVGSRQRYAEMAAQRRRTTGAWSSAQRLRSFSVFDEPASSTVWTPVAASSVVTANGTAAVGWTGHGKKSTQQLQVSTLTPGSTHWTSDRVLTENLDGSALAAGADNTLVAVGSTNTTNQQSLVTAASADGADWSAPVRLASIHGGTYGPILAAAANGRIALTLLTGNHSPIQYATRTPAGRWSTLTRVGTGDNPEIAVSSKGPVTLVWETFNQSGHYKLQTRTEQ